MTLMEMAKKGMVTPQISKIAKDENKSVDYIRQGVAQGKIVIPRNKKNKNKVKLIGIGQGLRVKVNANIGTSPNECDLASEIKKLKIATEAGADTVMDLSTGGEIRKIRRAIIENSSLPLGTVPIYQVACQTNAKKKSTEKMEMEEIFRVIEEQAEDGVDFITVHCGVTQKTLEVLKKNKRLGGIVSRGGVFLARWMEYNRKENPLYEYFDRLLKIASRYEIILSLGDGLRPGCLADATDLAQIAELSILGELTKKAWRSGVQVMIEGPGHIPLNQVEFNVKLEKKMCYQAPFYVLGPLVTDIAVGYDHIVSAIGGAVAGWAGADFLCYVTPSEHLGLPKPEEVKEGIIAARIAAHSADLARGIKEAQQRDKKLSQARRNLDWKGQSKLVLDPEKFKQEIKKVKLKKRSACTMCGKYCAIKNNIF